MKKRIVSSLFAIILVISILPIHASAAGSLSNFTKTRTYAEDQFTDVSNQWFASDVKTAFEYNLIDGSTPTTFSPSANLTIAAAIKLAACVNSMYKTGTISFPSGASPWYQPYVDYALANGIIQSPYANYAAYATRSDMAVIFANALPDEAMTAINDIKDNTIPDVSASYSYGPAVYKLYRAGILTGSDSAGTFYPSTYITRDSVAAITARMANVDYRKQLALSSQETSSSAVATLATPAVFYIEVYDMAGKPTGSGSGFFISSSGLAVTNFHVINGSASAKITIKSGKTYNISSVVDYDSKNDLALLQIDGSGFPYLALGDSDTAATGATIYAVGYPLGIDQTFSKGAITNASHTIDGLKYIMIDASISPGSSGGALLNAAGQVIGVTSGAYVNGQNLNLAVPINLLQGLKRTGSSPMSSFAAPLKYTASAFPSVFTLIAGGQRTVTIGDNSGIAKSIIYSTDDESIVSSSWGYWYKDSLTIPLNVLGLAEGATKITIYFYNKDDVLISKTNISITVTPRTISTVPFYANSTVPDFGAFIGTPSYYSYFDKKLASMVYYYRQSDIKGDLSNAVSGYADLLASAGYIKNGASDYPVTEIYYEKAGRYVNFMIGNDNYSNDPCFCIVI